MAYGDKLNRASRTSSGGAKYTSSQIKSNRKKAGLGLLGAGAIGAVGLYALSNMGNSSSSNSSSGSSSSGGTGTGVDDGTGTGTGSSGSSGGDGTKTKKQVVEIPIDNYEDALKFALLEWHKIRRDDGRQVECSVLGAVNWKCGEWSKVILPTYEINEYMYITRASHTNNGGEWTANITLVDYPPGWGEENLEEQTQEEENAEEDETSADEEETTEDTEDTETE